MSLTRLEDKGEYNELAKSAVRLSELAEQNVLLSRALEAVQRGELAVAERLLAASTETKISLHDVFSLYQSELRVSEEELRQSQQRIELSLDWFAGLFRTLPVAAVLLDEQGMIADANAFAFKAFALSDSVSRQAAVPIRRLLTTQNDEMRVLGLLSQASQGHSASLEQLPLRALDGRLLWVDLHAIEVPPRSMGSSAMTLCVLSDQTNHIEAQRAKEQAAQAEHQRDLALSASRAKTQLLSRVSHELRTPLNAVLGFSQLLLMDRSKLDSDSRRKVELIADAGKSLLALVNDVLELNQAESGQLALNRQAVELHKLVCEVLALQEPMAMAMSLTLLPPVCNDDKSGVWVDADPRRVREVVTNLVSNAIKYNRPGGLVQLELGQDSTRGWITVADTGRGLTAEQLAHLFEPFNRLGADERQVSGTGLGLSIARTMTELMGGTLEASAVPDKGAIFKLVLPRTGERGNTEGSLARNTD